MTDFVYPNALEITIPERDPKENYREEFNTHNQTLLTCCYRLFAPQTSDGTYMSAWSKFGIILSSQRSKASASKVCLT